METYLWRADCMFLPADTLEILSSSRTDSLMCRERRRKSFFVFDLIIVLWTAVAARNSVV